MLQIENLESGYGKVQILKGINLEVQEGQIVTLLGANGAGKTTTLRTVSGLIRPTAGRITYRGRRIDLMPPDMIVRLGISHVPEGRQVFPELTVLENLMMGAYTRADRSKVAADLGRAYEYFPVLAQRQRQLAATLSGGEQQMLAIGRALMSNAQLLLLDEPSLGLAPKVVREIFQIIRAIRADGRTIVLVEQNANHALAVSDYAYVLETGSIVLSGASADLRESDHVRQAYLGHDRSRPVAGGEGR